MLEWLTIADYLKVLWEYEVTKLTGQTKKTNRLTKSIQCKVVAVAETRAWVLGHLRSFQDRITSLWCATERLHLKILLWPWSEKKNKITYEKWTKLQRKHHLSNRVIFEKNGIILAATRIRIFLNPQIFLCLDCLEYSRSRTGLDLVTLEDKKNIYMDFASTRLPDLKLFTLERGYTHRIRVHGSRIQKEKLRIRLKYLDGVCGRGLNVFLLNCTTFLESWSHECGFKCYWSAHKNGPG